VGCYVLGNVIVSIAGTLTFVWLLIFGVPYPLEGLDGTAVMIESIVGV
jgi:hypothetical protein